jgi:hypothetical protein
MDGVGYIAVTMYVRSGREDLISVSSVTSFSLQLPPLITKQCSEIQISSLNTCRPDRQWWYRKGPDRQYQRSGRQH